MGDQVIGAVARILLAADAGLVAAVAAVAGTQLATAAARRRALHPRLPLGAAVRVGAADEVASALVPASTWIAERIHPSRYRGAADEWRFDARLNVLGAQLTAVVLAAIGAVAFEATGHAPWPMGLVIGALTLAFGSVLLTRRNPVSDRGRALLARRSPHLIAATIATELVAVVAAVALVEGVVMDAAGIAVIDLAEAAGIALAARLAWRLSPIPAGLVVTEAIWVGALTWMGVTLPAALTVALVWRLGMTVSLTVSAVLSQRLPEAATEGPADSAWGRHVHRAAFRAIGVLPSPLRNGIRRRIFDSMFSLSQDPWSVDAQGYEQRKRLSLVAQIPTDARTVLEYGCSDAHNLQALAGRLPASTLVGTDISVAAVEAARRRTAGLPRVTVMCTADDKAWSDVAELVGTFDVVVLAEVLYYLGDVRSMSRALAPVRQLMHPGTVVVMLHGAGDAGELHGRAMRALDVDDRRTWTVDDTERPYTITMAGVRLPPAPR